jgi:uncharacterized protein YcfJ
MKRSMITATAIGIALVAFNITNAFAEQYNVTGVVKSVNPVYKTVSQQIPTQSCSTVDVPVYGNNGNSGSSVFGLDLEGAIIGGVIGNNVTKNVDNGGAAGALIGGLLGSQNKRNNQQIVGYRQEQRCSTSYSTQQQQVFSHNNIVIDVEGLTVSARTARQNVQVGSSIPVTMTLQVQ